MKPLILIDTHIIGGPGRGLFQLVEGLKCRGIEYLLCSLRYPHVPKSEFAQVARAKKLSFRELNQRSVVDPSPVWECLALARSGGFTHIQSHGYKTHFIACIVSKFVGLPWIAFAHGWTAENLKVKLYHSLDRIMLRSSDVVVAVSPALHQSFAAIRGNKRTELVLNAVDVDELPGLGNAASIRKRYLGNPKRVLIGAFGRLSPEKGHDLLIRAFSEIESSVNDADLLLLGDGPERKNLETLAAALGISHRVHFVGHDSSVRDFYEAIDLLVLPSRSEGLPNVVLEAMGFAVPVIATNVGAVREVIHDGDNGWIVPPENVPALSGALREALWSPQLRVARGKRGKAMLHPKFCPNARVDRIIEIYRSAISERGLSPRVASA